MANEIQAIRPTQFESEPIGRLSRAVNMSRGDVNFIRTLVSLPGKPNDPTLAVNIAIRYESNVNQQATTWNLDAPTSVLGLGWSMPLDYITLETAGSLAPGALSYVFHSNGVSNALIADGASWVRATLDATAYAAVAEGTVAAAVVSAFATQGLALSATATVSGSPAAWMIADDTYERVYTVVPAGGGGSVLDGGTSFQLQSYEFWRISYYAAYERWEIVTDQGEIRSFGGGVTQSGNANASAGNSVSWGVKWGGPSGNFLGPSQNTDTQVQYARAWYLQSRSDAWGASVLYGYNEFTRGGDGLLGYNAEQAVGTGGLPYTKAVYLTSITDIYGRKVTFSYDYKDFTSTAQEYMDPHQALTPASEPATPPANLGTPNAYQDRYEVLYLQSVTVSGVSGPLYTLNFSYLAPTALSTLGSGLAATAAKRYLSVITETNAYGQTLPCYSFTYCLDPSEGQNLGAVSTITYPQGGVASWSYASSSLSICDRELTVNAPEAVGSNATPFVWLSEDFAVSVWLSQDQSTVTLDVYTWVGSWMTWSGGTVYQNSSNLIISGSMQAQVNDVSIALAFATQDGNTQILLFSRNPNLTASWTEFDTILTISGTAAVLSGGSTFIVATSLDGSGTSSLYLWTWNWQTGTWSGTSGAQTSGTDPIFAIAENEYYLTATTSGNGTDLALQWIDASANWHPGGTASLTSTTGYNPDQSMVWDAGAAAVAMTFADDPNGDNYDLVIATWDASYNLTTQTFSSLTGQQLDFDNGLVWPPPPVVASDSFVGVRQNVFRYDGGTWNAQSFTGVSGSDSQWWAAYAYGPDVAVQVFNDLSDAATTLMPYDANGSGFSQTPITTTLPSGDVSSEGWPSVSEDFLIARNAVFFRGSSTTWSSVTDTPAYSLPAETGGQPVPSLGFVNGGPDYLAYLNANANPDQNSVQALVLQNGGVLQPVPPPLSETSYSVAPSAWVGLPPGQAASGPGTFVTYPANTAGFGATESFTIYRYAGQALSGPVTDYPVQSLTISDGFGGSIGTAYEFDATTAACDPTGRVVKYYRSASYTGTASPSQSAFGRTVYSFENGYATDSPYTMLDGLQTQSVTFAGAWLFATLWQSTFGIDPDETPNDPATTVTSELVSAFAAGGVTLSTSATLQYVQIDGEYAYWIVTDGETLYNIDFTGDESDPAGVRVFSGAAVQSTTTEWTVYTQRNTQPTIADESPMALHGGYARPMQTTTRKDSVPLTTTYSYTPAGLAVPFYGAPVSRSWSFPNASGQTELHTDSSLYAAAVYAALLQSNVLAPVATTRHQVTIESSTVTTSAGATSWISWQQTGGAQLTVWAPAQEWSWIGDPSGADTGIFPFSGSPDPSLWRLRSTVNAVTEIGVAAESTDAGGVRHSTLYDPKSQVQIAQISNASFFDGQAFYTGFESYEALGGWSLSGGAEWTSTDAHTGSQSLSLPVGASADLDGLTPDPSRTQLFSAWYKTGPDWNASGDSGWTLTLTSGGQAVGNPVTIPFSVTNGEWVYTSATIPIPSGTSDAELTISVNNAGTTAVGVDDVVLLPLTTEFIAQVYDQNFQLPLARLDGAGRTWRTLRDGFQRKLASTAPGESPVALQVPYLSLASNASYSSADPNVMIGVKAFGAGICETFQDDTGWQNTWSATPSGAFTASGGVLQHTDATTSATLAPTAPLPVTWALYVETVPLQSGTLTLSDDFTIALNTGTSLTLSATTGQWSLTSGGATTTSLNAFASPLCSVLLVVTNGTLLFWANGQLQFGQSCEPQTSVSISTGKNALGLRNLVLLAEPAAMLRYNDATGKERQTQLLTNEDYLVRQVIRDARGKRIVTTKSAPGLFGSGKSATVGAYRPGFVDVDAFLANLDGEATMTGDVANWFDGTNDTNDQGYPYTRTVLEPSSLARVIERGFPGEELAVINEGSTSPSDRATFQTVYGSSAAEEIPFLSVASGNAYQITTQIDPAKAASCSIIDASGATLGRFTANGSTNWLAATQPTYGNGAQQVSMTCPDSYTITPAVPANTQSYNGLQQLALEGGPDTGSTQCMYDTAGRLRFLQDAEAAANGYVVYMTWDTLGRILSRGVFTYDWTSDNAAQLQEYANQATWPEGQNSVSYAQQRTWSWDGDGTDPLCIGHLATTTATTGSGSDAVVVTDQYTWNSLGLRATRVTSVSASSISNSYAFSYEYDNQGRIVSVTYPNIPGLGFQSVLYSYDGRDKTLQITDDSGSDFASYVYDTSGHPIGLTCGSSGATGTFTYDSPGRLIEISVQSANASFNSQLTYGANGIVSSLEETLTPAVTSFDATVIYSYDPLGRLTAAGDSDTARSLAISFTTGSGAVDQNGNIQSIAAGSDAAVQLSYTGGTNQISSQQASGGTAVNDTYLANGALSTRGSGSDQLEITYVPGSILPATISQGSTSASYGYDSRGNRVTKQVGSGSAAVNIYGGFPGPVLSIAADGTVTAIVYGPTGLVAVETGGARYFVVTDYLRSPRVAFDSNGNVAAAYAYNAYGQSTASQESIAGLVPLGFTGQQYDEEFGLYNFGTRLYDPSIGRFLSPDPAGQFPSSYCYAGNLPTMLTDPTGQMSALGEAALDTLFAAVLVASMVGTAGLTSWLVPVAAGAVAAGYGTVAGTLAAVGVGAGIGAAGGAVANASFQGLWYGVTTPPGNWSSSDFEHELEAAAIGGAVGGALSGGISGGIAGYGVVSTAADETPPANNVTEPDNDQDSVSEQQAPQQQQQQQPANNRPMQPTRAESSAARTWEWKQLARPALREGVIGAAGGAVRGYVQAGMTNVFDGQSFNHDVVWFTLRNAATGFAFGAVGGAFGEANDTSQYVSRSWNSIKTSFMEEPAWYAVSGLGGAMFTTVVGSMFFARTTLMQPYGNGKQNG